eukprot:jgi/Botrbrau1/21458/Bobra.0216s0066.1
MNSQLSLLPLLRYILPHGEWPLVLKFAPTTCSIIGAQMKLITIGKQNWIWTFQNMGEREERDIVVGNRAHRRGLHAIQWVLDNIYRDGDVVHVIHVAKIKAPTTEYTMGPVGSSMRYRDLSLKDVHIEIEEIRAWLAEQVVPLLKQKDAPYNLHLFVDKINATAHDVAKTIVDTANSVGGPCLSSTRATRHASTASLWGPL